MRPIHIAGLVGVIAAGLVLWLLTRGDSGAKASKGKATDDVVETSDDNSSKVATRTKAPDRRPDRTKPAGDDDDGAERPFETITKDGTRVRDFRTNNAKPRDLDIPVDSRDKTKKVNPRVVTRMGLELRRLAKDCAEKHADEIGENARVQPRATFTVREERLTVTDVELSLTAIAENGSFQSCMESAALGVVIEAPGHIEIPSDKMLVPIDL